MNSIKFITLFITLIFLSCGNTEKKQANEFQEKKEKAIKDSINLVNKIKLEQKKKIKDSIINIEQNIAIGNIKFGITKKEFEKDKKTFLKKCKLPEMEYYKNLTFFYYKLGEYGFSSLYGWYHNDSLYNIRLTGPIVEYDEYNRIMPDQYEALMNILTKKYGKPLKENGLPEWTKLDKGYFKRAAIWIIGNKRIEVRISCEGVKYYLNLEIFKPEVERQIQKEKEEKENKATQDALEIL